MRGIDASVGEVGYHLSSEEHPPQTLADNARRAEEAGFTFALVSDHFHPWTDRQGESPFVWAVLGAIAQTTERLRIGTGVTCPTIRIHPAIIAHAAATSAALLPGRFFLGLGTGENLNEHVLGDRWPAPDERVEMLEEAIEVIRLLWRGGYRTHRGKHYTVDRARLFTLPEEPPPIYVAAGMPRAAELAGRAADGFITTSPDADLARRFDEHGGAGKPRLGKVDVCWAESQEEGLRTAFEWWPNSALTGPLLDFALPADFEDAAAIAEPSDLAGQVVCGPDPERHLEAIRAYADAGFDHVWIHQFGADQEGFFRFYEREVLPRLATTA